MNIFLRITLVGCAIYVTDICYMLKIAIHLYLHTFILPQCIAQTKHPSISVSTRYSSRLKQRMQYYIVLYVSFFLYAMCAKM